jgi:ferredoxin
MTVSVLMCGDGLAPDDRAELVDSPVRVVDALCRYPEELTTLDEAVDGLVLVLHNDQVAPSDVEAQIRAAGLDPLGVPMLDADEYAGDPTRLGVAVAAASARAAAFAGSNPAHAKPVFPDRFTRRSLFTVPQPSYIAAPAIDSMICASGDGCELCVRACPQQAYTWVEGRIAYDKDICEPCGICVTTCPTGAVSNPAATPEALAAQIQAIVAVQASPVGVLFRCSRGATDPAPTDWQVVEVPCTGMVTAPWAVAPLLLGATQVAVVPCSASGCDRGLDARAEAAVDFAAELLVAMDIAADRVTTKPTAISTIPLPRAPIDDPFGPRAAARVYAGLRKVTRSDVAEVAGTETTLGIVAIDAGACTMCTMCVKRCPTGALDAGYSAEGQLTISFDPVDCTACDQCVSVCPEVERGAISVEHLVDFAALAAGRTELNRSATHACERCGQPVAPTVMMDRISDILGDDPALMAHLTRLCLACRGSS